MISKNRIRIIGNWRFVRFGKYPISVEHIKYVIKNISKDQHLLTASDVNAEDKMNFKVVTKICSPKVVDLLTEHDLESRGTVFILHLIRDVLDSFLNKKDLRIQERIYKMWYSAFFF